MDLNSEYKAVRINNDNLNDFINIYHEAFKSRIKINSQRNKFKTSSFAGIENIGYIVYHESGEPVAFYGVYPLYAYINKAKVLVAQSGDTMTKPDHIGLGLFISAAELTYKLSKENHIIGVFGFPSRASYPTTKRKLNWKFVDALKKYKFFVPTIPISIFAQKINFINYIYLWWVRLILTFYKKADIFESSVIANGQDGICRDDEFWNYKMNSKNKFAIQIGETSVVFKTNGSLSIGDISVDKESVLKPILRKLKWLSFLTFNLHVVFYVSPGTVLDEKLSSLKKSSKGLPIGFLNLSDQIDLSTLKFTYFDFDTF